MTPNVLPPNHIITANDERVNSFIRRIDRLDNGIEAFIKDSRPIINGEQYLTDKEVSGVLKLSRRSLHEYRRIGILPYHELLGKMIYKSSDIEKILRSNFRPVFNHNYR